MQTSIKSIRKHKLAIIPTMESRAGAFLKAILSNVLRSPKVLRRYLGMLKDQEHDLESQLSSSSECQSSSQVTDSTNSEKFALATYSFRHLAKGPEEIESFLHRKRARAGNKTQQDRDDDEAFREAAPYADEPAIFVHEKTGVLCCSLTKDMVSKVQKVTDSMYKMQHHGKQYDHMGATISAAETFVKGIKENLTLSKDNHEAAALQQMIGQQDSVLYQACHERDALEIRLDIFQSNLHYAMTESHEIFESSFGGSGLVNVPEPNSDDSDQTPVMGLSRESEAKISDTDLPHSEELLGLATYEKLIKLTNEVDESRSRFEQMPLKYEADLEEYRAAAASDEDEVTRSEFDRMFVAYQRNVTRYWIDMEESYEVERANAVALGVIPTDWGTPSEYGSSCASSSTAEERVLAAKASYTSVEDWRAKMLRYSSVATTRSPGTKQGNWTSDDKVDFVVVPEPEDIDKWDAVSASMSDSISTFKADEHGSRRIRQWQNITGHR